MLTYKVRVSFKRLHYWAPVRALEMLGGLWAVGYVTGSGRHVKLKIAGNEAVEAREEAEAFLAKTAKARRWQSWPEHWPVRMRPAEEE